MRAYRYLDWLTALFVSVLLISNIASSAKIVNLGIHLGPLPLIVDAGTLLFPVSYIFGDVLVEVYGYRRSRRVIWAGFGASALMSGTLWLVGKLPGEPVWESYAGQTAYDAILGGVSSGGIIVASLAAYFAGEFLNSYVMARMKLWSEGRYLWARTIGSTLVGEGVDTALFIVIASAFGVFAWESAYSLIVTNFILKVSIEALATPITYQIINWLKRAEQEDFFDRGTDFNPFKLSV